MEIFLVYSTRYGTNVYRMFNLTTQSISIISDITCLNLKNGKMEVPRKKSHDSSNNEEQLINDDYEHYRIYHQSNTQVNNPNNDPEEIITEPDHQLETNTTSSQHLQPSNIIIHLSGKIFGANNSRIRRSGIVTGMTCVASVIRQVETNSIDQDWNHTDIDERRKWKLIIKDEITTMIQNNVLSQLNMKNNMG